MYAGNQPVYRYYTPPIQYPRQQAPNPYIYNPYYTRQQVQYNQYIQPLKKALLEPVRIHSHNPYRPQYLYVDDTLAYQSFLDELWTWFFIVLFLTIIFFIFLCQFEKGKHFVFNTIAFLQWLFWQTISFLLGLVIYFMSFIKSFIDWLLARTVAFFAIESFDFWTKRPNNNPPTTMNINGQRFILKAE